MADRELEDLRRYLGDELLDCNREPIGTVQGVYVNEVTARPEWLRVAVGMLGRTSLVPVDGLSADGVLRTPHEKDFVVAAPAYPEPYGSLPPAGEASLCDYYGLPLEEFGAPHAAKPARP